MLPHPISRRFCLSLCVALAAGSLGLIARAADAKISKGRVVDGRIRIHAAIVAGLDDVPTAEVAEDEAASVVLQSLLARKHYTKSGRAFLAVPLLDAALAESSRRATEALIPIRFQDETNMC